MTAIATAQIMARLLALLALIQSLEYLKLGVGAWQWKDLEVGIDGPLRFLLADTNFFYLNILRLAVALRVLTAPQPEALLVLLILHVLTLLRWLGNFNGGSDYMNLLLLAFTTAALLWPQLANGCVWYMALQTALSYARAGWSKVQNRKWRDGEALPEFLHSALYTPSSRLQVVTSSKLRTRGLSWFIILFEFSFPLSLLNPPLALVYLTTGFFFHLVNGYVFGLNRFIFAWLAAYPSVYYFSLCFGSHQNIH